MEQQVSNRCLYEIGVTDGSLTHYATGLVPHLFCIVCLIILNSLRIYSGTTVFLCLSTRLQKDHITELLHSMGPWYGKRNRYQCGKWCLTGMIKTAWILGVFHAVKSEKDILGRMDSMWKWPWFQIAQEEYGRIWRNEVRSMGWNHIIKMHRCYINDLEIFEKPRVISKHGRSEPHENLSLSLVKYRWAVWSCQTEELGRWFRKLLRLCRNQIRAVVVRKQ